MTESWKDALLPIPPQVVKFEMDDNTLNARYALYGWIGAVLILLLVLSTVVWVNKQNSDFDASMASKGYAQCLAGPSSTQWGWAPADSCPTLTSRGHPPSRN